MPCAVFRMRDPWWNTVWRPVILATTIFKAIDAMDLGAMLLARQLEPYLPRPTKWPFWLLMVDVTPYPRPHAQTLEDRDMVYRPEAVKGKLPATIGHQYSTVALGVVSRTMENVRRTPI